MKKPAPGNKRCRISVSLIWNGFPKILFLETNYFLLETTLYTDKEENKAARLEEP